MSFKRGLGYLGSAALLFAVLLLFEYGFDFLFHPWAYPALLGKGIEGTWKGTFNLPHIGPVSVVYHLHHELYEEEGPPLEGESTFCSAAYSPRTGSMTGKPSWLGKDLSLSDSSNYSDWGSPSIFTCQYESDRLNCTMNFSRELAPKLKLLAERAGIRMQREPIHFLLTRAEPGAKPGPCPPVEFSQPIQ
jgi:hypothetical protein